MKCFTSQLLKKGIGIIVVMLCAAACTAALAADPSLDPASVAANMTDSLGSIASICQMVAVISGLGFFIISLFEFKRYGEMRTFMSQQMTVTRPLMLLLAAVMFLVLPPLIGTAMFGVWGHTNPMRYIPVSDDGWAPFIPVVIMFVRLIGVTSFIRGVFLVSRVGGGNSQPGTLPKALIHVVAAILCINIVEFSALLRAILPF